MMAMTTRCDDDDKNIMLFLLFRDSFTLSRICCSTKWRICSPNTRSFVLKLLSHSGTCVPKRCVTLKAGIVQEEGHRSNQSNDYLYYFYGLPLKVFYTFQMFNYKKNQEEGQKRFPTHLTNICFVPDPLVE